MEKFGYGVISECRFRVSDVALWVKMAADVSYGDFGLPAPIPTMSTRSLYREALTWSRAQTPSVTDPMAAFAAAETKLTKALSSVPDHARGHVWLGYGVALKVGRAHGGPDPL